MACRLSHLPVAWDDGVFVLRRWDCVTITRPDVRRTGVRLQLLAVPVLVGAAHLSEVLSNLGLAQAGLLTRRLQGGSLGVTKSNSLYEQDQGPNVFQSLPAVSTVSREHRYLTMDQLDGIVAAWRAGASMSELARQHRVHRTTVRRHLILLGLHHGALGSMKYRATYLRASTSRTTRIC